MPKGPLTRVIYIRNPKDGGSHFRTINGKYAPRKGKAPQSRRPPFRKPGTIPLTGGAIYKTPRSKWFIAPETPTPTDYGNLPGYGITLPTDISIIDFQPAQTLWGGLWYLANGVAPDSGEIQPPQGTPGTLKSGGTLFPSLAYEAIDRGATGSYPTRFGGVGVDGIPSGLRTRSNVYNLPAFLQWYESIQNVPDLKIGGITFNLSMTR